jgi:thiol-disulfide isomerase/thioredoxin
MKKVIVLVAAALLAACVSDHIPTPTPTSTPSISIEAYYFFSPRCPYCVIVKPYVEELAKMDEVDFDFCNVAEAWNCSNESIKVADEINLVGIPTVVVKTNETKVFVGYKEVLDLGSFLREFGLKTPEVVYQNVSYDVQECIECHESEGRKPPSTFNCTYCCHEE